MTYETFYIVGIIGLISGIVFWLLNIVKEIRSENKRDEDTQRRGFVTKDDLRIFEEDFVRKINVKELEAKIVALEKGIEQIKKRNKENGNT